MQMNAKEFMTELYKGVPADKATYLFTRPDNATYPYTIGQMDRMLEKAMRLTQTKDRLGRKGILSLPRGR